MPDYDQELQALWRENHEEVRVFTARANNTNTNINYCTCPRSEPGKIKLDAVAHLPNCPIRAKLQSGRYTKDVPLVEPHSLRDGYQLGVPRN